MNHVIILAGGEGSRFWPLSSAALPKQFLSVGSDKTMFDVTLGRMRAVAEPKHTYIATNKAYQRRVRRSMRAFRVPQTNILLEPQRKNTLGPIGYLSCRISKQDPDAVCIVIPSDHVIKRAPLFLKLLRQGVNAARQGSIVTLGIVPTGPETGYGYIKAGAGSRITGKGLYRIARFTEKPSLARARKFLAEGKYYWNSGIFIFRADVMLKEIRKYAAGAYAVLQRMQEHTVRKLWRSLPDISIDYAVMEKTARGVLLPAACGWTDLGSWSSLAEVMQKNKQGTAVQGNCLDLESSNSLVWSECGLVATLGLKDVVVVHTKNAVLVCSKEKVQDVKRLVQQLKQKRLIRAQ